MWQDFFPRLFTTFTENSQMLWDGLVMTLIVSFGAFFLGLAIAVILVAMRTTSGRGPLARFGRWFVMAYVTVFRAIPDAVVLLLLFFVFLAPFGWPVMWIGIIGLALPDSAFAEETLRASVQSISPDIMNAARDLGASRGVAMRKVILPIAFRKAIPDLANLLILTTRGTAVLGFISIMDLMNTVSTIVSRTMDAMAAYMLLALMYFVVITLMTIAIKFLEVRVFKVKQTTT